MHKKETGKKARRPLRWRHRMLCCLAVLAALGTAYAMVLPALTAEEQPLCGLHEHTHTQACYSEPELICGLTQTPGHTHGEDCAVPTASEQAAAQSTQEPTAQQEQPRKADEPERQDGKHLGGGNARKGAHGPVFDGGKVGFAVGIVFKQHNG